MRSSVNVYIFRHPYFSNTLEVNVEILLFSIHIMTIKVSHYFDFILHSHALYTFLPDIFVLMSFSFITGICITHEKVVGKCQ